MALLLPAELAYPLHSPLKSSLLSKLNDLVCLDPFTTGAYPFVPVGILLALLRHLCTRGLYFAVMIITLVMRALVSHRSMLRSSETQTGQIGGLVGQQQKIVQNQHIQVRPKPEVSVIVVEVAEYSSGEEVPESPYASVSWWAPKDDADMR